MTHVMSLHMRPPLCHLINESLYYVKINTKLYLNKFVLSGCLKMIKLMRG